MNIATTSKPIAETATDYFDVIIVGAGISGINAAYHLQKSCPERSFTLLETQDDLGGTWHTHKYPGIRSDSDLFTFGYKWKPWTNAPIASAGEILKYLNDCVDEQDIRRHIQFKQKVLEANWDTEQKTWTLTVEVGDEGVKTYSCNFLWMCQGYYRHSEGYTPDFPGADNFKGKIIHPQTWPEDFDYTDKNVVVIGSGATAATLVPAMAGKCKHITMLQRSPTYFAARPNREDIVEKLKELDIPEEWIHEIARQSILKEQKEVTRRSFEEPEGLKEDLFKAARQYLGDDIPLDPHFTPSYRPWRQRLALIPDGDLFLAIRRGDASVVTDQIEQFTETGIDLKSGAHLDADVIITATGFNLCALGDIDFTIDGKAYHFSDSWAHRGILFSGLPNLAWVFGYLRTSWTMRSELVSDFVCRLLNHMKDKGASMVVPELRPEDKDMPELPFVDPENFNAGYLMRDMHLMPKQGDRQPWVFNQDYYQEKDQIPATDLEDGTLIYK
ncbi:flavin-containing monooxygenase [Sneathiella limimaris]|uniref:flavin-containing monooxygenase n=1 Tax=Sneathiella limimaris TaxID=1964213 RepID=UPI00146E3F59|nr:NAD(P)/FAD-dependent oxidoreductase [Sneathiella limimaris]